MVDDWHSFGAEFFEASVESFFVFVVSAGATIVQDFGSLEARFNVGLGNIEKNGGFDIVATTGGGIHYNGFFARPTTN